MTAAVTPRLNLMSPVDSDLFLPSDYATTFGILDSVPGTTIVSNYAALTALNWGTAQHGSKVIQMDNGAEWYWYNPSGSGTWKRSNSIGIINQTFQSGAISTTVTSGNGAIILDTGNFTIPGGRPVLVEVDAGLDNSSGTSGQAGLILNDNGGRVQANWYRPGSQDTPQGFTCSLRYYFNTTHTPSTPGSTHRFTVAIICSAQSAGNGGGGTTVSRESSITVTER